MLLVFGAGVGAVTIPENVAFAFNATIPTNPSIADCTVFADEPITVFAG